MEIINAQVLTMLGGKFMKIESVDDFELFKRLNEIEDGIKDFFVSAYRCDLYYKEQGKIKAELRKRGYKI